ncbi:hypothetical protein M404DRAFT_1002228 [Pisolithus tinctorius Marx 270]|uniref:Uncharacterized protein n=1 Tax=Pisolithus tinctorius Marx 270 TaxID=870435 RepID=A0A0C3P5N1_PISTI|nr:hypothetical protein M404DRAFT_1002228 [Pisolithus tinctorius Marx 270]
MLHLSIPFNRSDRKHRQPAMVSPRWIITRTDGKANTIWALPAYSHAFLRDGRCGIDEYVWGEMHTSLTRTLHSFFPSSGSVLESKKMKMIVISTQEAMAKVVARSFKDFIDF